MSDSEDLEVRVLNSQVKFIEDTFGKDVQYNLGWGISTETDGSIRVETKVYVDPIVVVITHGEVGDADFEHEVEDYD